MAPTDFYTDLAMLLIAFSLMGGLLLALMPFACLADWMLKRMDR